MLQRRLVEGNQRRLQGKSPLVQAQIPSHDSGRTSETKRPALLVNCKVRGFLGSFPLFAEPALSTSSLLPQQLKGAKSFFSFSVPASASLSRLSSLNKAIHQQYYAPMLLSKFIYICESPLLYHTLWKCMHEYKSSCSKVQKNFLKFMCL